MDMTLIHPQERKPGPAARYDTNCLQSADGEEMTEFTKKDRPPRKNANNVYKTRGFPQ